MKKAHFVAIGGQGMSGIARILLKKGYFVTGSDLKRSSVTERLERLGAKIFIGHRPENILEPDVVVISSAISNDNPEVREAKRRGIPVVHRMDMLLEVVEGKRLLAVAGAHGKTTTTSMIAWILIKDGREPTYLVGGEFGEQGNACLGKGQDAVFETDESDGSFLKTHPDVSLVTNIDNDHLDFWGSMNELEKAFYAFLEGTKRHGYRVICVDDQRLDHWAKDHRDALSYSIKQRAFWQASDIKKVKWGTVSRVLREGRQEGLLKLNVPGLHNVQDALGAIAATSAVGIDVESACHYLTSFPGAKRRLERVGECNDVLILDDFAHHPSEIKASIEAVKDSLPQSRIIVIFQPHRYSRTRLLQKEFGTSFSDADVLIVTDIYPGPGEAVEDSVSSDFISNAARAQGHTQVYSIQDMFEASEFAAKISKPGDVIVTMGAGDIWKTHHILRKLLAEAG